MANEIKIWKGDETLRYLNVWFCKIFSRLILKYIFLKLQFNFNITHLQNNFYTFFFVSIENF